MPKTYSRDLRCSIIRRFEAGYSRREVARVFGVSVSFVIELLRRHTEGLPLSYPRGGSRHDKLIRHQEEIIDWVKAEQDITLPEIAVRLRDIHGTEASASGLSKLLRRNGYTYKKNAVGGRSGAWKAPKATP